jgi:hypothetical protein
LYVTEKADSPPPLNAARSLKVTHYPAPVKRKIFLNFINLGDRPLIDHLKEVAWAFFLVLLFLVCLLVIFSRQIGFKIVFLVCLGFAVIVAALFLMILLTEFL